MRANLQGACLWKAHLQGTDLHNILPKIASRIIGYAPFDAEAEIGLQSILGAALRDITLDGGPSLLDIASEIFGDAIFDAETKLPDGSRWTPDTDMNRFTDPDHPNFWHLDDPVLPASWADDDNDNDDD